MEDFKIENDENNKIKDWPQREAIGQKFYLIPVEIDEFCNIRQGKYVPRSIKAEGTWHSNQKDISYNDPGVESFVEFQIPPENILVDEIKQIDIEEIPKFEYIAKTTHSTETIAKGK